MAYSKPNLEIIELSEIDILATSFNYEDELKVDGVLEFTD